MLQTSPRAMILDLLDELYKFPQLTQTLNENRDLITRVVLLNEVFEWMEGIERAKVIVWLKSTYGIRAEDIYDKLFVSEASPDNTIRATCEVIEPLGSDVYLYLNSGKNVFVARVGAHNRPEVNHDMDLVFDMSKVHFFDVETEETIV